MPKRPRPAQEIHCLEIESEPEIVLVAPPTLSWSEKKRAGGIQGDLKSEPDLWDGPFLQVAGLEGNRIFAFPATYAWSLATENGFLCRHSLGNISLSFVLCGPRGALWQRRSQDVIQPGRWDLTATGSVDGPVPEPTRQEMLREIREEIGLGEHDLREFQPVMMAWGRKQKEDRSGQQALANGVLICCAAKARAGVETSPGREVSDLAWFGNRIPEPAVPQSKEMFPSLSNVLVRRGLLRVPFGS